MSQSWWSELTGLVRDFVYVVVEQLIDEIHV